MRPPRYVGISGIVSPEQQKTIMGYSHSFGLTPDTQTLLGVKAVHKTQHLNVPNKYGPLWYPVGQESFSAALASTTADNSDEGFGVAQIYLDVDHVNKPGYKENFMRNVCVNGAGWLSGLQFDLLPWHVDPEGTLKFLGYLKETYGHKILVQCHKDGMVDRTPQQVVSLLGRIGEVVDYILFDASHGTGTTMDPTLLGAMLEEAQQSSALDNVGFGVAGGLESTKVANLLPPLLEVCSSLSWDAEGALHPQQGTVEGRPLVMDLVKSYLHVSAGVISSH